jgi:MarR family transcriptional regulator, organic hydroperoxide resistance regulator
VRHESAAGEPRTGVWPPPTPVADLRAPTVQAIFRLAAKIRSTVNEQLAALGLLAGEEYLLVELWERDGCSQSELAGALGIDRARLSRMLQRLQAVGFLERRASDRDRRDVLVNLTPTGRELRYRIEELWQEVEWQTVGQLSPTERGELLALLRRIEAQMAMAEDP